MKFHYRQGNIGDLAKLKELAIISWSPYQDDLTTDYWKQLSETLSNEGNYLNLLQNAHSIICETKDHQVIGMAFLVPSGNPTDIYDEKWSYIRFVSVHPLFGGQGIGRQLTIKCIDIAKKNKEQIIALHTSEIMGKAMHLYESLGFEILREIEPRLGKRYWLYKLEVV